MHSSDWLDGWNTLLHQYMHTRQVLCYGLLALGANRASMQDDWKVMVCGHRKYQE